MTEESNISDNSQEENVVIEDNKQDFVEKDIGDLVREAAEASKKQAKESAKDESPVKDSSVVTETEVDDDEVEEMLAQEPKEPRGRRAKKEYEARLAAEKSVADMKAQMDKLAADNEAMRKLFDSLTSGTKSVDESAKVDDIDSYLRERGLEPDNFLDEEAKKAVVKQFKELDEIKNYTKENEKTAVKAQFENVLNNSFNSLPDNDKKMFTDAAAHVIVTEIRQIKAMNPNISDDDAYKMANKNYEAAMFSQYQRGVNPINFMYNFALASGFEPQKETKSNPIKSDIPDMKKMSELQKKAGAPSIDVADTGGLGNNSSVRLSKSQREAIEHLNAYAS